MANSERQGGFTLLALLLMLAGLGVALAAAGTLWSTHAQREREAELLFVGDQYRNAIASFHQMTPGTVKKYPPSLEALLEDPRFPNPVRHLRRLYPDPITGKAEWGLVRGQDGGIQGIYSLSELAPLKRANFPPRHQEFEGKERYADWVFGPVHLAPDLPPAKPKAAAGSSI